MYAFLRYDAIYQILSLFLSFFLFFFFFFFFADLLFHWYSERAMFIKTFAVVFPGDGRGERGGKKWHACRMFPRNYRRRRRGNWTFSNKSNGISLKKKKKKKKIRLEYPGEIKLPKSRRMWSIASGLKAMPPCREMYARSIRRRDSWISYESSRA